MFFYRQIQLPDKNNLKLEKKNCCGLNTSSKHRITNVFPLSSIYLLSKPSLKSLLSSYSGIPPLLSLFQVFCILLVPHCRNFLWVSLLLGHLSFCCRAAPAQHTWTLACLPWNNCQDGAKDSWPSLTSRVLSLFT